VEKLEKELQNKKQKKDNSKTRSFAKPDGSFNETVIFH
jgi:hypothetical protein